MRTTLLLAFIIGILSFQAPQQAHACSCAMPRSTQESIDETEVVFSGMVEDVRASGDMQLGVSMTVAEDWKGLEASERGEVTVYTANNSAACGYAFEEGEEYLVYGYRDAETDVVRVGLCSATKPLDQADEDLAALSGEGTWACTMDAKMCPDGSYVGRQGPNCEFEACPGEVRGCTKELKICPDGTGVGRTGPNCAFEACPGENEPNCAPYVCANGTTHPRCSEDGHVINYFAEPCHMDGGEEGAPFEDVPSDHVNAEAIHYVKSEGIVQGYADGTFKADATINRAEFVKILMGSFDDDGRMCKIAAFSDVDQTAWYAPYAHKARCQGVMEGYPDGTFKPAASINFVEAAKILVKAYGLEASSSIPACDGDCPWYRHYVLMLEMRAAIPTSIVRFDQAVTRGEMAEMIHRLKKGNSDKPSPTYEELFAGSGMMTVTLYFGDRDVIRESDCGATKPLVRTLPKTATVADTVLETLFLGVTLEEEARGYSSSFGAPLSRDAGPLSEYYRGVSIEGGVATVKFTEPALRYLNGAACAQMSVTGPIEDTLSQFSSVDEVRYEIDGEVWTMWDA